MSRETRTVYWTIEKARPSAPVLSETAVVLDGAPGKRTSFEVSRDGDGAISAVSSDTSAATVFVNGNRVIVTSVWDGTATVTVTVGEGANYLAYSGTEAVCTVSVSASEYCLTVPAQVSAPSYDGNTHSPEWDSSFDSGKMDVVYTPELPQTNAGQYLAAFTPKSGYQWGYRADTTEKSVAWVINKAGLEAPVLSTYSLDITGRPGTTSRINVTRAGDSTDTGAISAVSSNTNVATVSVSGTRITVTSVSSGSANISVKIGESENYYYRNAAVCSVTAAVPIAPVKVQVKALPNGARDGMAGADIGGYALFAGGRTNTSGSCSADVYAYDSSLTLTMPTSLSQARAQLIGIRDTDGKHALFAGGYDGSGAKSAVVDAYDSSLTRTVPSQLSAATQELGAASVSDDILFDFLTEDNYSRVEGYSASLTRVFAASLSTNRHCYGANAGRYAVFAGGYDASTGKRVAVADAYDGYLSRVLTAPSLSLARYPSAVTTGNYALFAGGFSDTTGNVSAVVDEYSPSLTLLAPQQLSDARQNMAAAGAYGFAVFAGGKHYSYSDGNSNAVDAIQETSLTRSTRAPLSSAKTNVAGATAGTYILFAGGYGSGLVDDLEVYRTGY